MDVFLVPVGADRYESYCEVPDEPHDADAEQPTGVFRRLRHGFSQMLAEAERERRHGRAGHERRGWMGRLKGRTMRWVAEAVAEQQLLWHLRRQTAATFFYPVDMAEVPAFQHLRKQLAGDFDKHRFWLIVDSLGFVTSGVFFLVPGPNIFAYYFAFRMVGHFLSLRGARHGLNVVTWRKQPSAPLTGLRQALAMHGDERQQRIDGLAAELRLEHLSKFIARTANGAL